MLARLVSGHAPYVGAPAAALAAVLVLAGPPRPAPAQQVIDGAYRPAIPHPEYAAGKGPLVLVDRFHHTFYEPDEFFGQLADLLRRDGYRVRALNEPFTPTALAEARVLVVVNPESGHDPGTGPIPPAFTPEEVKTVREWVRSHGGSMLLVVDHMPFPAAAADLGEAFGVEFMNGFAVIEAEWDPLVFRRADNTLRSHPITDGRRAAERIDSAVTFVSGQAFRPIDSRVRPLLVFGPHVVSVNTPRDWKYDASTPRVPVEGWLQGAALEDGAGRVAMFGESAMFAAQLVGPHRQPTGLNSPIAPQNLQLLLNTLHWLSRAPGFD